MKSKFTPSDKPKSRLRELDGWRAVAVFLVLLNHVGSFEHPGLLQHVPVLRRIVSSTGPLGVKIFFVISGFVICRLLLAEESRYGTISIRGFYCRRVFRILPPFYLYLAAVSLLAAAGLVHGSWKTVVYSGLFLMDISAGVVPHNWFVGHTWSLAVEEQFYLVFPVAWLLTLPRWRGKLAFGLFLLWGTWNILLAWTGGDAFSAAEIRSGFACISWGIFLAIHEERARGIARRASATLVALVALVLFLHPVPLMTKKDLIYEGLLMPPGLGLILMFSLERGERLRAFLCNRAVQLTGLTSYGIYLWQQLFTAPKKYYAGVGATIPFLLPLFCVIVMVSYVWIEKPAIRYGRALSQRVRETSLTKLSRARLNVGD